LLHGKPLLFCTPVTLLLCMHVLLFCIHVLLLCMYALLLCMCVLLLCIYVLMLCMLCMLVLLPCMDVLLICMHVLLLCMCVLLMICTPGPALHTRHVIDGGLIARPQGSDYDEGLEGQGVHVTAKRSKLKVR
jgi:hypothetical protein